MAAERRIGERFATFYAPLALGAVLVSFFPLFADVTSGDVTRRYGSLWELAGRGHAVDLLGVVLLAALVGALVTACFHSPRTALLPGVIAVLAVILGGLLLARPQTGTPTPDLADGGRAGVVLGVVGAVLAATHAVVLMRGRRYRPHR